MIKTSEREIIPITSEQMKLLLKALDIDWENLKCDICNEKVNIDPLDFGLFSRPTKVVHNNILCLTEWINKFEIEEEMKLIKKRVYEREKLPPHVKDMFHRECVIQEVYNRKVVWTDINYCDMSREDKDLIGQTLVLMKEETLDAEK